MNVSAFPISQILGSDRLEREATGQVGKERKVKLERTKGWETDSLVVLRTVRRHAACGQGAV